MNGCDRDVIGICTINRKVYNPACSMYGLSKNSHLQSLCPLSGHCLLVGYSVSHDKFDDKGLCIRYFVVSSLVNSTFNSTCTKDRTTSHNSFLEIFRCLKTQNIAMCKP